MNNQSVSLHDPVETDVEILDESELPAKETSLAIRLTQAELQQQIETSRAMPRSVERVSKGIKTLVTLDRDSAQECIYMLPRGGKKLKGPSIRMAEIISSQWGNCRDGARVVHVDRQEMFVEAEGVFHDLETNRSTVARVRRRISDKNGDLYTEDMIIVTGNAAAAIARRNAILAGVPKPVWRAAYGAAEAVLAGEAKTMLQKRDDWISLFNEQWKVPAEQLFELLGVAGAKDLTVEHMELMIGMNNALKSGEETVDSLFQKRRVKAQKSAIENPLAPPKQNPPPTRAYTPTPEEAKTAAGPETAATVTAPGPVDAVNGSAADWDVVEAYNRGVDLREKGGTLEKPAGIGEPQWEAMQAGYAG